MIVLPTSLIIIRNRPSKGGTYVQSLNFKNLSFLVLMTEAMLLSVFYYCICAFLCRCRSFNPSLCRLSPFLLPYVAVSRP